MTLRKNQEGFTIIELLIVIIIIIILAGLVLVTLSGAQEKARNAERTTDIQAVDTHLEAYFSENQKYPLIADLNSDTFRAANLKGLDKEALRDPKNSSYTVVGSPVANSYSYETFAEDGTSPCDNATTDCTKFTLTAKLEGGKPDVVKKQLQ